MEYVGLNEFEAHEAEKAFYKHDRYAMRHLAPFWDPEKPIYESEVYIARVKELEQQPESTLLSTRSGDTSTEDEGAAKDKEAEG